MWGLLKVKEKKRLFPNEIYNNTVSYEINVGMEICTAHKFIMMPYHGGKGIIEKNRKYNFFNKTRQK